MGDSLTGRTVSAAKWTYLSTFITAGLQVVVTAVLARLVAPEAFGLIAMSTLVLRFGQYFAQMGVGQAIVQRAELSDDHASAGFWSSVVIGGIFTAVAWALAPLAAKAFGSAELVPVLRWMSLTFVISGTSTTSFALLRRGMRFKAIALTDVAAYVLGYGAALGLALSGAGVWALVFAGLGQATVSSLLYNVLARPILVPVARWQPYRELLGFGTTVSFISFLEFLNSNLDTMVVGRVAGPAQLGYYTRALSLTGLPMQYMSTSLSRVLLPSFSRIQEDRARVGRAYISLITVFAGIGLPVAFGMSGASTEIVAVLLGSQWTASVPVMRIVAVASVAAMLSHFGGILLEATARLREKFTLRVIQLAVFVALLLALSRYGLIGYALAFAISESGQLLAQSFVLCRVMSIRPLGLIRAYVPGLVGGGAAAVVLYGESVLGEWLASPSGVTLVIQIVSGAVILATVALSVRNGQLYRVVRERTTMPTHGWALRLVRWSDRVAGFREVIG
ncbi:MAG: lipopolysaccharide biosynthesis protein [Coriobacteriia bacterium]|nr:lipopolysaccharide biosynthesis protein [Coriobacteriia bacterium]